MSTDAPQASPPPAIPPHWTMADLQRQLGDVPADRILLTPTPGTARPDDARQQAAGDDRRLCELIDGCLVEKATGWYESLIGGLILTWLNNYLRETPIGLALGADGLLRILPHQVRIPDVCFISWARWPDPPPSRRPVPEVVPDLVIEVLSESNTPPEIDRKLRDYQRAGVTQIWIIDPQTRTGAVCRSDTDRHVVREDETMEAGDLLPGFHLSLSELFAAADRAASGTRRRGE